MKLTTLALATLLPTLALAQDAPALPEIGEVMPVTVWGVCAVNGKAYLESRRVMAGEEILFLSDGSSFIVYEEQILDRPGILAVLSNQTTGTVSVVMLYQDGVACEILTGENFEPQ